MKETKEEVLDKIIKILKRFEFDLHTKYKPMSVSKIWCDHLSGYHASYEYDEKENLICFYGNFRNSTFLNTKDNAIFLKFLLLNRYTVYIDKHRFIPTKTRLTKLKNFGYNIMLINLDTKEVKLYNPYPCYFPINRIPNIRKTYGYNKNYNKYLQELKLYRKE